MSGPQFFPKKGRKRAVVSDMLARQRTANYLERKAQRKLEWSGVRKLALRPETSLANLTVGQWVDAMVRVEGPALPVQVLREPRGPLLGAL